MLATTNSQFWNYETFSVQKLYYFIEFFSFQEAPDHDSSIVEEDVAFDDYVEGVCNCV